RVCGADDAVIFRIDGQKLRRVSHHGLIPEAGLTDRLVERGTVIGHVVLDRRTVHVPDIEAEEGNEVPITARTFARPRGVRTHLGVPLLREGAAIGVILIRRLDVRPFTPEQISLLETFADQAVIAIENVRLFKELQTSNRELTTALDTQTATSDILRV